MSSDPPRHRRGAPVALRPRGSLIVVDQKGRPARPEGQGQEGPVPGRDPVPAHRRDRAGARRRHDRVRPPDRAGRRRLAADDRRPLARRVRVLPVRHVGAARRQPRGGQHRRAVVSSVRQRPASTATTTVSSTGTRSRRARSASGAKLGLFLDIYGVELDNDSLKFPDRTARRQGVHRRRDQVRRRGRRAASRRVGLATPTPTTAPRYIANFDNIRDHERRDGVRDRLRATRHRHLDAAVGADLVALGAADTNQTRPETALLPGDTSVTDGTVTGATTGDTVTGEPP